MLSPHRKTTVPRVEWQGRGLCEKGAVLEYVVAAAKAVDVEATAATTPEEIPTSTTGGITTATSGETATSAIENINF